MGAGGVAAMGSSCSSSSDESSSRSFIDGETRMGSDGANFEAGSIVS
jgi:hypothetical protein